MEVVRRKACRAILLTPEKEILLIKVSNPSSSWTGWVTPGGGMDAGESESEGLKRELKEELGTFIYENPIAVWKRFHAFSWAGKQFEQSEVYFLIRIQKFQPASSALTETEVQDFKEIRWWRLDEIKSSQDSFAPRQLALLVEDLLANGCPAEPVEIGI